MNARKASLAGLMVGAIGVVFGDIGTSPIYALQVLFSSQGHILEVDRLHVLGIISLILWCVTIIVSIKYVAMLMPIDSKGEGGIMTLLTFVRRSFYGQKRKLLILAAIIGISLFYGDSMITPAISVLSAVEGLNSITPGLSNYVLPITLAILVFLFWLQRFGSGFIGKLFGPVMLTWFVVIGAAGLWHIIHYPDVLFALLPTTALSFAIQEPLTTFFALTAVVLAITGAEALYADMGHFGRQSISRAWFMVVFPALALCYMGQGAYLLQHGATSGLFFHLFPEDIRVFIVILATMATLVASQSIISGAFSLTRQAIQLNLLPRMKITFTSTTTIGQVYIPFVNFILFVSTCSLVMFFGSSENLAHAFGMAESGTMLATTILFLAVIRVKIHASWYRIIGYALPLLGLEISFVASNSTKLIHGAWVPILIAMILTTLMVTWYMAQSTIAKKRRTFEGELKTFIRRVRLPESHVIRVPGKVVYIGHHPGYTPLALSAAVHSLHELHERVVVIYVKVADHAHVPKGQRVTVDNLGYNDGVSELTLHYGYRDSINIPKDLASSRNMNPELDFDPHDIAYFISVTEVVLSKSTSLAKWQKKLYAFLARNAINSSSYYKLPVSRTVEVRTPIKL